MVPGWSIPKLLPSNGESREGGEMQIPAFEDKAPFNLCSQQCLLSTQQDTQGCDGEGIRKNEGLLREGGLLIGSVYK